MVDRRAELQELLAALAPRDAPVQMRTPLATDEADWFLKTVAEKVIEFRDCPADCFRYKKYAVAGPDHFQTPAGGPRHLFSKPGAEVAWLNREYLPHIAAYGRAILAAGYDAARSSFSLYRRFTQDLIAKRQGQSYETDAEFYDDRGTLHLQIEAKASRSQTEHLAEAVAAHGDLARLPVSVVKEIEYVLDLRPRFLWIVGPESIDPAKHVFEVHVEGHNATFTPRAGLPPPPR